MSDAILVLNAGSSSVKFSVFEGHVQPGPKGLICDGEFDGIGHRVHFVAKDSSGTSLVDQHLAEATTHEDALATLLNWVERQFPDNRLVAAGHRVVHGGSIYTTPVRIDPSVIDELRQLIPLAPLHQPHNLAAITAVADLHPALPQVACFDTAFHHTQPEIAAAFALPRSITDQGVRRYGFHGLSYEYIAGVLPDVLGPVAADGRVVVAHLGSGASMCAMHRRQSVATTMGFTALAASLGGLDALVFTAGIGEHAPEIRRRVCEQAGWLGIDLDGAANTADAARITTAGSRTSAWVIPTNEDLMIARHTWRLTEENGK